MISEELQSARKFEEDYLPFASRLPLFHVTAGIGWINDPNGFSVYKGEYHLFYQYYPYDTKWGPMHWGHVKTSDFIKWERLPAAMAPDHEYDRDGCFSGSAVELPDGRHLLIYTGVRIRRNADGVNETFQTQCIAVGDGRDYEKVPFNPVITEDMIPEGNSVHDFRDPKIWREGDEYYCVAGNRGADRSGEILLYKSRDAFEWEYVSTLAASHDQYGKMWECPDFFSLDGKDILLVSPQEMNAIGLEFHPGNGNVCLIGKVDRTKMCLEAVSAQAIDYGLDFYAPQTLKTGNGRRVMIAWMQNWETASCKIDELRFFGQMTVPRELSVRGGRLCQNPVRELENYRGSRVAYNDILISDETSLHGISGRLVAMTVRVRPAGEGGIYKWFRLRVAKDGERSVSVIYRPEKGTIKVDRTHSGFPHDIVNVREFPVSTHGNELKMRIIMDLYSLEIFVNDGEQAASFVLYTPAEAAAMSMTSDGNVLIDVEKYDLSFD